MKKLIITLIGSMAAVTGFATETSSSEPMEIQTPTECTTQECLDEQTESIRQQLSS